MPRRGEIGAAPPGAVGTVAAVPDAAFSDPRLAGVYDALEGERDDLDAYVGMAHEFVARTVVDIGCGTGCLAVRLAAEGFEVVGTDPAGASLAVAAAKPGAARVTWVHGDAPALASSHAGLAADLAVMTGNVAQVFLTDADWESTLRAAHALLRPGGRLVFETRDPARRAWERWDGQGATVDVAGVGRVSDTYEVTGVSEVEGGDLLVSFRSVTSFHADGAELTSLSTLRFRQMAGLEASLARCGFAVAEVRDAPDRPGLEWVVVADRRPLGC